MKENEAELVTSDKIFVSRPNIHCGWAPKLNISKGSGKAIENISFAVGRWYEHYTPNLGGTRK